MKVLLVDDHPLMHDALRFVLPRYGKPVELLRADSGVDARRVASGNPDLRLILLDLGLPDVHGLSLIESLQQLAPQCAVVALSGQVDVDTIRKAITAGAMGFIPKSAKAETMFAALDHVLNGGIYLPPEANPVSASQRQLRELQRRASDLGFTERQWQVLSLLLKGKPTKLICRDLNIAEGTVKIHISAIFRILKVANRTEAVYAANRLGLMLDAA